MLRTITASVVTALALLVSAPVSATGKTQNPPPPGARANRPVDQMTPRDVVDMMDAYAVVQAQDNLQLNDAQYGQFISRLRKLQQTRRQNQQGRNQILMEIRRLVNPPPASPQAASPPDENAIRDRLKALREHDDRAAVDIRKAMDALDEVMDARQQARFRLFEEQLERRKLDLLMRARKGAGRGGTQ